MTRRPTAALALLLVTACDSTGPGSLPDAARLDASRTDGGDTGDAGGSDADTDGGTTLPDGYAPLGTPAATAAGRGSPPVVFWPKPVFAHPDVPLVFTMVAYDPDHDRLLYSLRDAPPGMTIDANGTIRWTPAGDVHEFSVEIDDGRGEPVVVPVTLAVDASRFLFVAPGGDDGAAGTIDAPFASVEHGLRALSAQEGGGTVYIRGGTYDIAWNWERAGVTSPFRGTNGTPDAPYVVRGYPGENAVLDCGEQGHGIWTFGGRYILHADIEVRRAAAGERGGAIIHGSHNVFQNVTVRDSNWSRSQNCTGFLLNGEEAVCHRCIAEDNYDRESDHWNSSNFLVYTDSGPHTVYILDSFSSGSVTGFKMKHAGEGRLVLHGSRDSGSGYGWAGIDDETTIRFNTFEDNEHGIGVGVSDPNSFTRGGMHVEHNTIVRARQTLSVAGSYGQDGVILRENVFVLAGAPGEGEGDDHFAWVWPWEASPAPAIIDSDENCFWGTSQATGFRFGSSTTGFEGWQARGFDVGSRFADPGFEAGGYQLAAGSGCADAGARVGAWD